MKARSKGLYMYKTVFGDSLVGICCLLVTFFVLLTHMYLHLFVYCDNPGDSSLQKDCCWK